MNKVRFGIIGCGGIAARFAEALNASEDGEFFACAARDSAKAEAFCHEHGGTVSYGDYDALVHDPEVEAVYIALVNSEHAPAARKCIEAGKAVLCEKPFFLNRREAEEAFSLAREKNVLLMEGFWTRINPSYRRVRQWIDDDAIGTPSLARLAFCFNLPYTERTASNRLFQKDLGGGAFYDVGVYPFEYVTGLFSDPKRITSSLIYGPTGVDLTAAFTMEYDHLIAQCFCSIAGSMDETAYISGEKGHIIHHHFYGTGTCELYDQRGNLVETFQDDKEEGFLYEISHFVSLMREGRTESGLVSLHDTLLFAETAERVLSGERDILL